VLSKCNRKYVMWLSLQYFT